MRQILLITPFFIAARCERCHHAAPVRAACRRAILRCAAALRRRCLLQRARALRASERFATSDERRAIFAAFAARLRLPPQRRCAAGSPVLRREAEVRAVRLRHAAEEAAPEPSFADSRREAAAAAEMRERRERLPQMPMLRRRDEAAYFRVPSVSATNILRPRFPRFRSHHTIIVISLSF